MSLINCPVTVNGVETKYYSIPAQRFQAEAIYEGYKEGNDHGAHTFTLANGQVLEVFNNDPDFFGSINIGDTIQIEFDL